MTPCTRPVQVGNLLVFIFTRADQPYRMAWRGDGYYRLPDLWDDLWVEDDGPVFAPCPGTVTEVGGGQTQTGIVYRFESCDTCGWSRPVRAVEAVQEVLL